LANTVNATFTDVSGVVTAFGTGGQAAVNGTVAARPNPFGCSKPLDHRAAPGQRAAQGQFVGELEVADGD